MAIHIPSTDSPNWLLRAASRLEKELYRTISYNYRVKIKSLKLENEHLIRKGEIIIPTLQEEVQRLKAELESKNKLCTELQGLKAELESKNKLCVELQSRLVDFEMTSRDLVFNESDDEEGNKNDGKEGNKNDGTYKDDSEKDVEKEERNNSESEVEGDCNDSTNEKDENIEKPNSVSITLSVDQEIGKARKREIDELTNLKDMAPDLLITLYPISRIQRPPLGSPRKRARSLSPPANNLPPASSSPLCNPPAMIGTSVGPGQSVKRKRRRASPHTNHG